MAISFNLLQVRGNSMLPNFSKSNMAVVRPVGYYRAPARATADMSQSPSHWAAINQDIDDHLRRAIPAKDPPAVYEPLGHFAFSAPRSSAPALCIAACVLVGGRQDQAMAAATALRLLHAAAYTREYPLMTARGISRASRAAVGDRAYGQNVQLLIVDGMVPLVFEILAGSCDGSESGSERVRRVVVEMARAMGTEGWIGGQFMGLEEAATAEEVSEMTEGGLHACGGACGVILGGGHEEEIERMRKFGKLVGVVKGLSKNVFGGKENEKKREKIEELKILALKELESFKGGKVHEIYSFLQFEGLLEESEIKIIKVGSKCK